MKKDKITDPDIMRYYLYLKKNNYSKATLSTYITILCKLIQVDKIQINDYKKINLYIIKKSKEASTINTWKNVISAYYKFLKNKKGIEKLKELRVPPITQKSFKIIEKNKFWKNIEKITNINHRVFFEILFLTGIRISEIEKMEIDKNRELFLIKNGKGNKNREIPIIKYFKDKIKDVNDCLIWARKYCKKTHRLLCKQYWGKWVTPHTFRRSFATNALLKGASLKIISKMMGHNRVETTANYLHYSKKDILKDLEKLI